MFRKSITRISSATSRVSRRFNSYQSGSEGATASSRGGFGDKEKAVENQWARMHDSEKIKALREALAKHEKTAESLKKDLEELQQTVGKNSK
ncbi:uncharacterized protein BYT42DRAFT_587066 [Radiomyces spectabilis]|uniref:uncharacterized protein n=1 Tax=Radiomyces spectabilis TaxID=64574 RepID=UPI00221EA774|nr:uncharacterized protein BYT42DRAFT_587066 [Radiomyces spectabilis]KAI8367672.1 hypothetical protein BYT42DRAFT_587066 [Radiomyces spectabilis]